MGMWIGRNRKARVTYGFDEIALVPGRVTINPNEVDITFRLPRKAAESLELKIPILASAFGLQQMQFVFLLMPATVPLAIASYSIVGEKQTRSLEAVIAAPISTEELLAGKAIAAITPAVLTVWLAYGVLIGVAALTLGGAITRVIMDPTWFATVFALGPAIGLVSVVVGIAISSRVNDPRAVQQIGTVILIPLVAFMVLQLQAGQLLATKDYLLAAAGVAALGVVGIRVAARLFGRESILTRWR